MARRRLPRRVLAERARRTYSEVMGGLSVQQIMSRHNIAEIAVTKDLAAVRASLEPEDVRKLRRRVIANARQRFSREKAEEFISFCQKIIRGEISLLPKPLLPFLSKTNPEAARGAVHLLRTTGKSFRQIAEQTRVNKDTVGSAYRVLVARGENIATRGTGVQISERAIAKKSFPDPENQITVLETMALKADLTLQEKAVVYCRLVGKQQKELAKIVGVNRMTIIRLAKSAKGKMSKVPEPKT